MIAACGEKTLCPENTPEKASASHTIIRQDASSPDASVEYWLADNEYIYPLKVGLNTIGRAPENDIVIPDPFISRRQCAIVLHHNFHCELFDTASKNGTLLNGQKLAGPGKLESGDHITLNNRQFVFMSRQPAPAEPEPHSTISS